MRRNWSTRFSITVPLMLVLVLVIAVACGGDDPTATSPTATTPGVAPTATISPVLTAISPTKIVPPQITSPPPTATPEPTATSGPAMPQPIFGGTPPMQLYTAPFGDFLFKGSAQTAMWADPVYNRIIEFDPETPDSSDIRGDLASEWSVADDGITYTFKLHPNVTFQDGTPLTAEDVVFSWGLFVDCESVPAVKDAGICPFTSGQHKLFSTYYASSRAIDDLTVELKTQFTAPALMTNLSQGELIVLPKHLIEAGTLPSETAFQNLIGSGPFKMSKHTRDVGTQYEKNTGYFKEGFPRLDGMNYFVLKDNSTIIAAYKTEQVLMSAGTQNNLSFTDGLQLAEEMGDRAQLFTSGPKAGMGLLINAKVPQFDNDEVRKAFMLIIHRQPIIDTLSDGFYPIGFPIAPDVYWFSRSTEDVLKIPGFRELDGEKHPDDIAEARRLFAKHGMGPGFKVAISCRTILEYCTASTLLADQFRRFLDWDTTVDAGDPTVVIKRFNDGDYQLGFMANSCGFPDPDSCLTSGYALSTSGMRRRAQYTNDKIIELSDLQSRELDQAKRIAIVREAEELLLTGQNAFPYAYFLMSPVIVNAKIKNYNVAPAYSFQEKWEHIWCDPSC